MKTPGKVSATVCVVLSCALFTLAQSSQRNAASIRVETDLVTVPATVLDESGKPVSDLSESAFRLSEDGVPQKIAKFETDTNRPLELALMVDSSLSTFQEMKFENQATAKFIRAVMQPQDLLGLFEFSDEVIELSRGFSSDERQLELAAQRISPGAGTSLYDAVVLASEALSKLPQDRRRVIVLVTDAGETTSVSNFETARHAAIQSGALVYTILIRAVENENGRNTGGEHALDTIIDSTGGAMYYPKSLRQLGAMYEQISRELRTQYLLSYYPDPKRPPGSYCRIELEVPGGKYTLHYRKGYIVSKMGE